MDTKYVVAVNVVIVWAYFKCQLYVLICFVC